MLTATFRPGEKVPVGEVDEVRTGGVVHDAMARLVRPDGVLEARTVYSIREFASR